MFDPTRWRTKTAPTRLTAGGGAQSFDPMPVRGFEGLTSYGAARRAPTVYAESRSAFGTLPSSTGRNSVAAQRREPLSHNDTAAKSKVERASEQGGWESFSRVWGDFTLAGILSTPADSCDFLVATMYYHAVGVALSDMFAHGDSSYSFRFTECRCASKSHNRGGSKCS
jgi:hypothetical protein